MDVVTGTGGVAAEGDRHEPRGAGHGHAVLALAGSSSARTGGILVLSVLAVVFTLYLGKEIILPVVLAVVLKLLLAPVMRFLCGRCRLPKALVAACLILGVFGAVAGVGFTVSRPAVGWIKKVPESLPVIKERLSILHGPLDFLQNGLKELQDAVVEAKAAEAEAQAVPADPAPRKGERGMPGVSLDMFSGIAGSVANGTASIVSRFVTTMIVLFFLLMSGDRLLAGFVDALRCEEDRHRARTIAMKIERNITGYLMTITAMNAGVGAATGVAMWACGLGTPLLWGAMAFALNYVPILGPLLMTVILFAAGVLTLAWPLPALLPAAIYFVIHLVEGETVTPMLLAQRFTLNPVIVIVALFFWHGLWGIPGALLAVPLLAMFKILCDHVDALKPVGKVIGS